MRKYAPYRCGRINWGYSYYTCISSRAVFSRMQNTNTNRHTIDMFVAFACALERQLHIVVLGSNYTSFPDIDVLGGDNCWPSFQGTRARVCVLCSVNCVQMVAVAACNVVSVTSSMRAGRDREMAEAHNVACSSNHPDDHHRDYCNRARVRGHIRERALCNFDLSPWRFRNQAGPCGLSAVSYYRVKSISSCTHTLTPKPNQIHPPANYDKQIPESHAGRQRHRRARRKAMNI